MPEPDQPLAPVPTVIAAGVMSAAHSEYDPPMGAIIEASDVAAILGVMAEGHGVASPEASSLILARKAAGLALVLRLREDGATIPDLVARIAAGGPPWRTA